MNLEFKITQEEIDDINKRQPLKLEKESKWNKFWVKFGQFVAKGLTTRKWEFKIKF